MANHTTGAQRTNARYDKIWADYHEREKKHQEWTCEKATGNNEMECESKRGNAVSLFPDGSVRFTKFNCEKPVKVNGKVVKVKGSEACGIEVY